MNALLVAAAVCAVQLPPIPEFVSVPVELRCIEINADTGECLSWKLRTRDLRIIQARDAQMLRYIRAIHEVARHGERR